MIKSGIYMVKLVAVEKIKTQSVSAPLDMMLSDNQFRTLILDEHYI
jgi:hypothetical protein